MPKKTREQKMAAAIRRLKNQAGLGVSRATPPQEAKVTKGSTTPNQGYTLPDIKPDKITYQQPKQTEVATHKYDYVASDLKRIALFTVIAISLEVALNLTMRLQFVKLLLRRFGLEI